MINVLTLGVAEGKESGASGRESEPSVRTDGSLSASSSGVRRRRRRNQNSRCKAGYLRPRGGFIPCMLASKETLLNMSLRRGKFTQADQVLKVSMNG